MSIIIGNNPISLLGLTLDYGGLDLICWNCNICYLSRFLNVIYIKWKGIFSSLMQCKHLCDHIYFSENINLNPIFSLLFFESGFLIYFHIPNFVTL